MSIVASADRVEVGEQVTLTASVADDESPLDELKYEWTVKSGSIIGTGRVVFWRAPTTRPVPSASTVTLTVVETYSGREHRVATESPVIHVDASEQSVRTLVLDFLRDFTNSEVSPEACVRNFTDSCPGKARELADVVRNRREFTILAAQSTYSISKITFNPARTQSSITAPCTFTSIVKRTGEFGREGEVVVAKGICSLTARYVDYDWWLCDSNYSSATFDGIKYIF